MIFFISFSPLNVFINAEVFCFIIQLLNDKKIPLLCKKKNPILLLLCSLFCLECNLVKSLKICKTRGGIKSTVEVKAEESCSVLGLSLVDASVCQNPPIRAQLWSRAASSARPSLLDQPMGGRLGAAARGRARSEEVQRHRGIQGGWLPRVISSCEGFGEELYQHEGGFHRGTGDTEELLRGKNDEGR